MNLHKKIGVVGLGYVGLPLAVAFSKKYDVVGFDINPHRISELEKGVDSTLEVDPEELDNKKLIFASDSDSLKECNFLIVRFQT